MTAILAASAWSLFCLSGSATVRAIEQKAVTMILSVSLVLGPLCSAGAAVQV